MINLPGKQGKTMVIAGEWIVKCKETVNPAVNPEDYGYQHVIKLTLADNITVSNNTLNCDWTNSYLLMEQHLHAENVGNYSDAALNNEYTSEFHLDGVHCTNLNSNPLPDIIIAFHLTGQSNQFKYRIFYDLNINGQTIQFDGGKSIIYSFQPVSGPAGLPHCSMKDDGNYVEFLYSHPSSYYLLSCKMNKSTKAISEIKSGNLQYVDGSVDGLNIGGQCVQLFDYDNNGGKNDLLDIYIMPNNDKKYGAGNSSTSTIYQKSVFKQIFTNLNYRSTPVPNFTFSEHKDPFDISEILINNRFEVTDLCKIFMADDKEEYYLFAVNESYSLFVYNKLVKGDANGLPARAIKVNSDGKKSIQENIPAYLKNNSLRTSHMLTQQCQSVTYHAPVGATLPLTPALFKRNVVSASATKWAQFNGQWLPSATYAWNAIRSSAVAGEEPTTNVDFADFNHTNGASNPNWQLTGTIDKYNANGGVLQTTNPVGVSSSVIYSKDNTLPIASIANAKSAECFFTSFEDGAITWSMIGSGTGTLELVHDKAKTGQWSGRIRNTSTASERYAESPWQSLAAPLPSSKKFTFSGWVYTTGPQAEIFIVTSSTTPPTIYQPGTYDAISLPTPVETGRWIYLQKTFMVPQNTKHFLFRIDHNGATATGMTDVYFDDLKFYPSNSLMSCTYYDPIWRQPVLTVDANENPSKLAEFDSFGRPWKVWKVDKTLDVNDAGYKKVLLSQTEYQLYNTNIYPLINNPTASWSGNNLNIGFTTGNDADQDVSYDLYIFMPICLYQPPAPHFPGGTVCMPPPIFGPGMETAHEVVESHTNSNTISKSFPLTLTSGQYAYYYITGTNKYGNVKNTQLIKTANKP